MHRRVGRENASFENIHLARRGSGGLASSPGAVRVSAGGAEPAAAPGDGAGRGGGG